MEVVAKIVSESLLSIYPVFVQKIGLPLDIQMWSRFASYAVISLLFIDFGYIRRALFTPMGQALMVVTMAHIYTSYKGFSLMKSGPSYTIFYTYPAFILLLTGHLPLVGILVMLLGIWFIVEIPTYEGAAMLLLAAFSEALIYMCVKQLPTKNPWNHVFISYIGGGLLLTGLLWEKLAETSLTSALGINALIGTLGYYLRFYTIIHNNTIQYAMLSYVGVIMSYVYGWWFNGESITRNEVIGTVFIVVVTFMMRRAIK
jgi:drug/metabolite transporter (DMT)-like permease